jgi:excisionase family DNA binding protein
VQVLRLVGPLLENYTMNTMNTESAAEPFVDARSASQHMNVPVYYLTSAAKRRALGIPHYRIGRLLRFKRSELDAWLAKNASRHPGRGEEPDA